MTSLRLALLGYGRMGNAIEQIALERGHHITVRASRSNPATLDQLRSADVALDFSNASAVEGHLTLCAEAGIPLVLGTTGWDTSSPHLAAAGERIGIVIGANFSVGVAIVSRLAALLGQLLEPTLDYQLHIHELHHRGKKDYPSGTALMLARTLQRHLPFDAPIHPEPIPPIPRNAITLSSARVGTIAGVHTIIADSEADTIEITHYAKSRRGFALGAVMAAEWIIGKRGLYVFPDVAFEILRTQPPQ
ncbi:MAG: 4-hydroxy-tetrahydrodipicolinate reductase [Candidatus Kapaibacterium sp.]|nr:MAG: 4-hydroxy-tetrahydrodipicolinate reductase [Candidatus Kapabacteria bacterium]